MSRCLTFLLGLAAGVSSIFFDESTPMDYITLPSDGPFPGFDQYGMRRP